jgi:MATE family multidrug resistance protein
MATSLLYIAAFFQISDGIQCVGLGVLRGIGDTKIPTVITIFAYWIIGIPLGYILCFKFSFNLYGVWLALLIGLSLSAWLLSKRFLRESNKIHVDLVNPLTN